MKPNGNARLAIVGASTAEGVLLRRALEKRRVPGFDYLCGGGVMWVETGAMFCVWDDSSNA